MVWKGVIIEESLLTKSIINMVRIVESKLNTLEKEGERGFMTFLYIELDDEKKDDFLQKAVSLIKERFYLHICKGERMIVVFKNKMFEFSSEEKKKLIEARNYGLRQGIRMEQMPFEELIRNPYK